MFHHISSLNSTQIDAYSQASNKIRLSSSYTESHDVFSWNPWPQQRLPCNRSVMCRWWCLVHVAVSKLPCKKHTHQDAYIYMNNKTSIFIQSLWHHVSVSRVTTITGGVDCSDVASSVVRQPLPGTFVLSEIMTDPNTMFWLRYQFPMLHISKYSSDWGQDHIMEIKPRHQRGSKW